MIKLDFNNQIATDRTYLLNIGFPYDSIFLYQVDGTGSWYKEKTGGRVPRKEKDLVLWDRNAFKVELIKQEHPTIYINIKNRDGVQYPPVIYLEPYDDIIQYDHFERFLVGAILGIIFIAALYYFILFLFMKDFSHLSFIFYILSFGLLLLYTSAYGNEFIWNNSAILFMRLSIIIYPLPIIFFLLFGLTYLNLRGKLRTWYRIVWGNLIFMILTASALLLSELNKPFHLTSLFGQVVGWIHSAFVISSLLILFIPSVQAHSAKAELLSAKLRFTASKRNVPERGAKPNCFVTLLK